MTTRLGCAHASFIDAVSDALTSTLPEREFTTHKDRGSDEGAFCTRRRPDVSEISVYHFPQEWDTFNHESTACVVEVHTTVVCDGVCAVVYFAGQFAYKVERPNAKFWNDVGAMSLGRTETSSDYEDRNYKPVRTKWAAPIEQETYTLK